MKIVQNKITWLLAIVIFTLTSYIETNMEDTPSDIVDAMYITISISIWIVLAALNAYVIKFDIESKTYGEGEYSPTLVEQPILLIFLSIVSLIVMLYLMIIN